MEGIIKKIEGVDLNDFSHEELKEVVEGVASEYKELESNTERWAQSLLSEKKKLEKAIETFKNVNSNPEALDKLMESDKEIWQFILDKFYDGQSIDEIKNKKWPSIDELVEQKLNRKEVDAKLQSVRSQLPEDMVEKFDEEFKDITDGKTLSPENVQKYLKNAISNISDDNSLLDSIKAGAVWNGWNTKWRPTNEDRASKSVTAHLKQFWYIK